MSRRGRKDPRAKEEDDWKLLTLDELGWMQPCSALGLVVDVVDAALMVCFLGIRRRDLEFGRDRLG